MEYSRHWSALLFSVKTITNHSTRGFIPAIPNCHLFLPRFLSAQFLCPVKLACSGTFATYIRRNIRRNKQRTSASKERINCCLVPRLAALWTQNWETCNPETQNTIQMSENPAHFGWQPWWCERQKDCAFPQPRRSVITVSSRKVTG